MREDDVHAGRAADRRAPGVVAIVPMRHASERVPGKNFRPIAGRPLYHHVVETLLSCPAVAEVVIDTDSPLILDEAARVFPGVRLRERPPHLRGGEVPMNEVLLDAVARLDGDVFLQTHSTNPLLRAATVAGAVVALMAARPDHDSLFSVTRRHVRLWDAHGRPLNHDPARLERTQDLAPILEENSCLYVFPRAVLEARRNRIGERPLLFEIDAVEAWDIDEEEDFRVAELLLTHRAEWQR
jgi:CMP-N-acetylneuraminic acid synthetase